MASVTVLRATLPESGVASKGGTSGGRKLVRKVLSAELDPSLQVLDAHVRFANPAEVRPDIVFLGQQPRWVIVEVQNKIDPDKRRRWLLAASILFNEHQTLGEVFVITASRRVARWAVFRPALFT